MAKRKRQTPERTSSVVRRQARQRRAMQIVLAIFSVLLVLSMLLSLASSH